MVEVSNRIKHEREFIDISNKIHDFNPIKVLGVQEREIRHSKILAWLLDPKGNHNFGDIFLKEFIKRVCLYNQMENDIIDKSLINFEVKTEWSDTTNSKHSIDIIAKSDELEFIVIVENKIRAKAGKGQLKKYKEMIEREYSGYNYLPVFLTVLGDEPDEEPQWYNKFTHEEVYIILKELKEKELTLKVNQIDKQNKVINFINDYMDVLEELTNPDDSIFNKSLKLVEDHRYIIHNFEKHQDFFTDKEMEVLEFIRYYVKSLPNINFRKACRLFEVKYSADILGEAPDDEIITDDRFHKSRTEYWFMPSILYNEIDNKLTAKGWKAPYPISYFFQLSNSEISLYMELGPVELNSIKTRDGILEVIKENRQGEFNLITPNKEGTKKWVKLHSEKAESVDLSSPKKILTVLDDLYINKFKDATDQALFLITDLMN